MGKTFSTGLLTDGIWQDSSNNIGIGAAANASYKLQVTGTTNLTGALTGTSATFSSTITSLAASGTATIIAEGNATSGEGLVSVRGKNSSGTSRRADFKYDNADVVRIATASPINMQFETNDVTRLTLNGTTGAATFSSSVGIGGSPSDTIGYGIALDVQSSSGGALYLRDSSNPTTQYGFIAYDGNDDGLKIQNQNSSGYIRLNTNGSERMRITSSGNVGIGTTPQSRFEVLGYLGNLRMYGQGGVTENQISSNVYYNGSAWVRDNASYGAAAIALEATNGQILFYTTAATSGFPTERMRITSGGNVSIGNTQGNSTFTVSESTTGNPTREFNVNTGTTGLVRVFAYNRNSGGIPLALNDPGGNVLIGTTTDAGQKLQVNGTAQSSAFITASGNATIITQSSGWSTFYTVSNYQNAIYLVTLQLNGYSNYTAFATIAQNDSALVIMNQFNNTAQIQVSGLNIQGTQNSGSTQTMVYKIIKIS